jgi:mono/diheme cytochrome c family protein
VKKLLLVVGAAAILNAACSGEVGLAASDDPTQTPLEAEGAALFSLHCSSCHATTPDTTIVGPSLWGIPSTAENRIEGMSAAAYIQQSILNPGEYVVEGFNDLMPPKLAQSLTDEQVDAVIAYLLTLEEGR